MLASYWLDGETLIFFKGWFLWSWLHASCVFVLCFMVMPLPLLIIEVKLLRLFGKFSSAFMNSGSCMLVAIWRSRGRRGVFSSLGFKLT